MATKRKVKSNIKRRKETKRKKCCLVWHKLNVVYSKKNSPSTIPPVLLLTDVHVSQQEDKFSTPVIVTQKKKNKTKQKLKRNQ